MTLEELESQILAAVRYRSGQWMSDPTISDIQWWKYTSAIMYDAARARVLMERLRSPEWGKISPVNKKEVASILQRDFWYFPDRRLGSVENYWPYGLRARLEDRLREENNN